MREAAEPETLGDNRRAWEGHAESRQGRPIAMS
jgi:hypothetical protein